MGFDVVRSTRARVFIGTALLVGVLATVLIRCDLIAGQQVPEHSRVHDVMAAVPMMEVLGELATHLHFDDLSHQTHDMKAITSSRADSVRTLIAGLGLLLAGFLTRTMLLRVTSRGPPVRQAHTTASGRVLLNTICINRC